MRVLPPRIHSHPRGRTCTTAGTGMKCARMRLYVTASASFPIKKNYRYVYAGGYLRFAPNVAIYNKDKSIMLSIICKLSDIPFHKHPKVEFRLISRCTKLFWVTMGLLQAKLLWK